MVLGQDGTCGTPRASRGAEPQESAASVPGQALPGGRVERTLNWELEFKPSSTLTRCEALGNVLSLSGPCLTPEDVTPGQSPWAGGRASGSWLPQTGAGPQAAGE